MPLIALLPCIMSHQFGRRKGNFSEDTYTAIFCSKHHHWAQSHFRFENKDTNCICNPLQKTKPTKISEELKIRNEKYQTVHKPVNTEN